MKIGILAYGSLIPDPGAEIKEAIEEVMDGIDTPFNVEFARSSGGKRGGAPTLVPVKDGQPVNGKIFVLNIDEAEATHRLYRREIDAVESDKRYVHSDNPGVNKVVVERVENFGGVDVVLYTSIGATIEPLTGEELARLAIESVKKAYPGRDGITYLKDAIANGISTRLTAEYEREILRQTNTESLEAALIAARGK